MRRDIKNEVKTNLERQIEEGTKAIEWAKTKLEELEGLRGISNADLYASLNDIKMTVVDGMKDYVVTVPSNWLITKPQKEIILTFAKNIVKELRRDCYGCNEGQPNLVYNKLSDRGSGY